MAMKLRCEEVDSRARVAMSGEIDGASCDCLEHFWSHYLDPAPAEIELDMSDVADIDALGIASLVTLLRRARDEGARIALDSPPQTLAHTLYKLGDLEWVELRNARSEEPYVG